MKILFILPEFYPHSGGGISTYYLEYVKALKPNVDEIKVIVGSGYTQSNDEFVIDGIKVEYLRQSIFNDYLKKFEKFSLFPDTKRNIAAAWAMWKQSKQGSGFDIVECTDFGFGFVPWLVDCKIPTITRLHGSSGQIQMHESDAIDELTGDFDRLMELCILHFSTKLVTHSSINQKFWQAHFSDKKIEFIPPIFSTIQTSLGFQEKKDYGIVCGRIQQWKGPDLLCRALEAIPATKIIIKWYGRDTKYDQKISKSQQLARDFPKIWGSKIIPKDPIPNSELLIIQQRAKFAVIPSLWDMYNFTCLEYMSNGTIVICADGAGAAELIEHGVNGFKYSKDDNVALANCLKIVTSLSEAEYQTIIINAKRTLTTKLNEKKLIEANLSNYLSAKASFKSKKTLPLIDAIFMPSHANFDISNILAKQPLHTLLKHIFVRILTKFITLPKNNHD